MKAHIEHRWLTGSLAVTLYEPRPSGEMVIYRHVSGDQWQTEILAEGAVSPEPSLVLGPGMAEALADALHDALPPSGQMAEHLQDTREVRDRLLSLVEHVVHPIATD
jgi:hypothetical protein